MTADQERTDTAGHDETRTFRQMSRVARGGAIGLVGAVVSAVSGFLLVVVVTNLFSKHAAGTLFSATSGFLILVAVASLGASTGLARFMLRYETLGRRGDIKHSLRAAFVPVLSISILLSVVTLVFAETIAGAIGLDRQQGAACLRILAVALPAAALMEMSLAGTRAFGRMRTTVFVDKMFRSAAQPAIIVLVAVAGGGLLHLTAGWVVPYVLAGVLAAVLLRRFLRRRMSGWSASDHQQTQGYAAVRREFWSFTWPRSIARVSQMAIQRADIIIIAALRSPTEAAIYTAATRFVVLGQFGVRAVQQTLQPRFTRLLALEDHTALRDVFRLSTSWSMATAWPLYLVIGCAPAIYLSVFGEGYQDHAMLVVPVMTIAMLFAVFSGSVDTLLLMTGRSSLSLINSTVALAIDICLCFVLIPPLGIVGAAAAWGIAIASRCALAFYQVHRLLGINPWCRATGIVAGANVICFALPVLVLAGLDALTVPAYLTTVLLGGALYVLLLWKARRPLMLDALGSIIRRPAAGHRRQ